MSFSKLALFGLPIYDGPHMPWPLRGGGFIGARPTGVGRVWGEWGEFGASLGRVGASLAPVFGGLSARDHMEVVINRAPRRENVINVILDSPHPPTMLGKGCTRGFGVSGASCPLLEVKYY